jgi:hypothetical protein
VDGRADAQARVNRLMLADASKRVVNADENEHVLLSEIARARSALSTAEEDRDEWRREALRSRAPAIVEDIKNNDADGFLNGLLRADQENLFEGKGLLKGLLVNMGAALSGGQVRRAKKKGLKAFFTKLSVRAGPAMANFVSEALCGPSESSLRRWRRDAFRPSPGDDVEAIEHNTRHVVDLLRRTGFEPSTEVCYVAEDGTSFQSHLDVHINGGELWIYGIAGGPYKVIQ